MINPFPPCSVQRYAVAALALFIAITDTQAFSGWQTWPKGGDSELTTEHLDGRDSLHFQPKNARSIYRQFPVDPNNAYRLRLVYRLDSNASASPLKLTLIFKDKKNQTVTEERFELPAEAFGDPWPEFERILISPESSIGCQIVMQPSGGLWLAMADLTKERAYSITESDDPPPAEPDPESPFWKKQPEIKGFWTQEGEAAKEETIVKLGSDRKNLYVLFINKEPNFGLVRRETIERDGPVWNNDCNEFFLSNSAGEARQFIAAINGAQWDGRLTQKMDGDPYRADASWNGTWSCTTKIEQDRWISQWKIPFADLDEVPSSGMTWKVNFTRHRHAGGAIEVSRWNYTDTPSNTVDRFASLRFRRGGVMLERHVEPLDKTPLRIQRTVFEYEALLGDNALQTTVGDWWHDSFREYYPKANAPRREDWKETMRGLLEERGKIGAFGARPAHG